MRPFDLQFRPLRQKYCGMCGAEFDEILRRTDDHVFPRSWFGKLPPPNLPTWSVCRPCQKDLSDREERLVHTFANIHTHDPAAIADLVEKSKSSRRVAPVVARKFVQAPSGLHVPANIKVPKQDDLDVVFRKVTRGLFLWRHGRMQAPVPMTARLVSADGFAQWTTLLTVRGQLPVQALGATVWWVHASDAESSSGVWLFLLFAGVGVGVWAGGHALHPLIPAPVGVVAKE